MLPDTPGRMTHEDSKGNEGILGPSDLQWMTAAKGILHSEVPESREEAHGLQMWINLSRTDKMADPEYQEIPAADLTRAEAVDASGKVVKAIVVAGFYVFLILMWISYCSSFWSVTVLSRLVVVVTGKIECSRGEVCHQVGY